MTTKHFVKYDLIDFNKVTDDQMSAIVELLNGKFREQVHAELAPCTNAEFLDRYYELDEKGLDTILDGFSLLDEEI